MRLMGNRFDHLAANIDQVKVAIFNQFKSSVPKQAEREKDKFVPHFKSRGKFPTCTTASNICNSAHYL